MHEMRRQKKKKGDLQDPELNTVMFERFEARNVALPALCPGL